MWTGRPSKSSPWIAYHGTHHAVGAFTGIAFGQHLGTHGVWAIADYGEIAGDDAG
jgi:hypothetical protein